MFQESCVCYWALLGVSEQRADKFWRFRFWNCHSPDLRQHSRGIFRGHLSTCCYKRNHVWPTYRIWTPFIEFSMSKEPMTERIKEWARKTQKRKSRACHAHSENHRWCYMLAKLAHAPRVRRVSSPQQSQQKQCTSNFINLYTTAVWVELRSTHFRVFYEVRKFCR